MRGSILVVDDSAFTRRMLIRDLPPGLDADVVEAADGVEALEAFERVEPKLVFLDVAMPRMTGFQVLAALQNRQHCARIVVVSSEPAADIEPRARAMGAHHVLRKPWKRSEVEQAVSEAGLG